jgi:hypothetical protein
MRLAVLMLASACGRIAFDPRVAQGDAPAGTIDAPKLAVDAPLLDLDAGQCPGGYAPLAGSCYRIGPAAGWLPDELSCEADAVGAHLVVVDNDSERQAVLGLISARTWIGTSKRSGGYRTVTNDASPYLDLGVQTEPSEDCLSMHTDGLMYLHTCGDMNAYVCEFDGSAAVPTAY